MIIDLEKRGRSERRRLIRRIRNIVIIPWQLMDCQYELASDRDVDGEERREGGGGGAIMLRDEP